MTAHTFFAILLWFFAVGAVGWNWLFRKYCLEASTYFKYEVLPQLQNNSEWNDEAADLEDVAIPQTKQYVADAIAAITILMTAVTLNTALVMFLATDVPIVGTFTAAVAIFNASTAVWISITRVRYFKAQAHVYACYTLLQAEEFHKKSLEELDNKNGEE